MRLHFARFLGLGPPLLALVAIGCTGDDPALCTGPQCSDVTPGAGSTNAGFDVTTGSSITLVQGAVVQVDLQILRNGFDGPISATAAGLPAGVAASPLVIPAGATTAKLTLSSLPNAAQGTTPFTIVASDADGKIRREKAASLLVRGVAGGLDTTFGTAGKTTAPVGVTGIAVRGVVTQTDGKILVGGQSENDVVVARLGVDGMLDSTYGAQGKVTADLRIGGVSGPDDAESIALGPDGNAVLAGYTINPGSIYAVARFTPKGALDTTFNADGYVTTQVTPQPVTPFVGDFLALATIVQPDGKPVFCGGALEQGAGHSAVIGRVKTTGALDDTFGNGGGTGFFYRHAFVGPPSSDDTCHALALGPSGKIVAAGTSEQGGKRFFVARLDDRGLLDTTFGSGGFTQIAFPKDATAQSVHVLPDGRVLVIGDSDSSIVVARLDANGVLDTSFGGTGKVTVDVGSPILGTSPHSFLDASGRIVVSASVGADGDVIVARVLDKGTLDPTFGEKGHVALKLGAPGVGANVRIAQAPDGRIVVATNLAAPRDLVAFRLWN
jgi:uncharacterized delta-60 repeat protein